MKRLAIYCGSASPAGPRFIELARDVGKTLAQRAIGIVYGGGKAGLMGALRVRNVAGIEFRIGTGFTDEQRRHPPAVGSWISYTHRGHTPSGVPRFASYWRAAEIEL